MIALLTGEVVAVDSTAIILNVNGVGYEIRMPLADLAEIHIDQHRTVYTVMSVSQDAIALQGFLSMEAKRIFTQLVKVSGIGPKVALSLLSTLNPGQIAQAISDNDASALAKAPGLGKKGAQKIIVELQGSITAPAPELASDTPARMAAEDTGRLQVIEGLISLGWHQQDAVAAVDGAIEDLHCATPLPHSEVPMVLRQALKSLDSGR